MTLAKVSPKARRSPAQPWAQTFKQRIAKSPLMTTTSCKTFYNQHSPRSWVPEALSVLRSELYATVSAEKRPAKPYKRGKTKQKHAWLHTSAPVPRTGAGGAELGSCSLSCGVASCFWSQIQSCKSSFPVVFPQHLPPHQLRWEHLTGGGSTQLFSQLQNVQHKNHHNGTKHSIPEPRSGKISRKAIIWADQYNSIFIPVRRCFTACRPAYTLEIIHVFHVLAVPSSCEITRQRWTLVATILWRGYFKPYNKELCCPPK